MFRRYDYSTEYFVTWLTYRKKINKYNINKLSASKINKILRGVDQQLRFIFLHNVLASYNKAFYEENFIYLDKLKKIILKNKIILNTKETQFIYLLEERIFNKVRTLKILDTFYPLMKGENLYAKYKDGKIYFWDNRNYKNIVHGQLLLTNKRIIVQAIDKTYNDYEFYYSQIKKHDFKPYGFEFNYGDEKVLIRAHDQSTLCNLLKRFEHNKWIKPHNYNKQKRKKHENH